MQLADGRSLDQAVQQLHLEGCQVKVDAWGAGHPQDVAAILSAQTNLPPEVVALAAGRYAYGVKPITPEVLAAQQKIADAFHNLKLIPKQIAVRDAAPPSQLLAKE